MAFLSVLVGVLADRYMPELEKHRNETWFRTGFRLLVTHVPRTADLKGLSMAVLAVMTPALLTWLLLWLIAGYSSLLAFLLGFIILLFMFGPRSLFGDFHRYAEAVRHEQHEDARRIADEILEAAAPDDEIQRNRRVITRLLVLAGRRLFGVVFWFAILGPAGAVMFRGADILRHRAEELLRDGGEAVSAAQRLYGILEWAPSRLLAGSYALAGSFEEAMAERRAYYAECTGQFFEINEDILACTGRGALSLGADDFDTKEELDAAGNLLFRALVIWLTALALLTLIGWG